MRGLFTRVARRVQNTNTTRALKSSPTPQRSVSIDEIYLALPLPRTQSRQLPNKTKMPSGGKQQPNRTTDHSPNPALVTEALASLINADLRCQNVFRLSTSDSNPDC